MAAQRTMAAQQDNMLKLTNAKSIRINQSENISKAPVVQTNMVREEYRLITESFETKRLPHSITLLDI